MGRPVVVAAWASRRGMTVAVSRSPIGCWKHWNPELMQRILVRDPSKQRSAHSNSKPREEGGPRVEQGRDN
jgi:hypothetical protein